MFGRGWAARMLFMKLVDEFLGMFQVGGRFPGIVLSWIAFPVHKVFHSSSSSFLGVVNLFYIVFLFSFNFYCRWGWRSLLIGVLRSFVRRQVFLVEDGMNSGPMIGEVEFISRLSDLFDDFERSVSFVV